MTTISIRVTRETHETHKRIAGKERASITAIIDLLTNRYIMDGLVNEPSCDDDDDA